jgi:hypothetical protein
MERRPGEMEGGGRIGVAKGFGDAKRRRAGEVMILDR